MAGTRAPAQLAGALATHPCGGQGESDSGIFILTSADPVFSFSGIGANGTSSLSRYLRLFLLAPMQARLRLLNLKRAVLKALTH
jgi:hypothetical protein